MNYDFIALDFETASADFFSACALGLAFVKSGKIVETKYFLLKPPIKKFNAYNTEIHGLTMEDVKDAPVFADIWPEIKDVLQTNLLVAHAAHFDMKVLTACCIHFKLPLPYFQFIDTFDLFHIAYPNHQKGSLDYCAKFLNIPLDNHHNAMEDAVCCATITIKSIKRIQNLPLLQRLKAFAQVSIETNALHLSLPKLDAHHPFYGKTLHFSGKLATVKNNEALQYQVTEKKKK